MDEDEQFQLAFGEQTNIPPFMRDKINDIKSSNPDCIELNLQYQCLSYLFSDLALQLIGRYIANNTHLRILNLRNIMDADDSIISNIFRGLSQGHQVVEDIALTDNQQIGINGIRSMVPFLRNTTTLSKVDLSGIENMKTEGFEVLMNGLDGGPIEELNIHRCDIEDISLLGNYTISHLRVLVLSNNRVQSMGNITALQNYTNLETLDLKENNIGIDGCRTIANLLQNEDSRLETLNLALNDIDDEGAEIIASSLKHNNTLTQLSLYNRKITDRARCAFLKIRNDVSSIDCTYNSNNTLTDLALTDFVVTNVMDFFGMSMEIEKCIDTATNANGDVHTGREKVISTQLDSKERQRLCRIQGVDSPYSSIFVDIDPVVLPEILALIGGRSCGQSDLYRALVATAPELTSLVNKPAALKERMLDKRMKIDALNAECKRRVDALTAEISEMNEELKSLGRPDTKVNVNVTGRKRQRSN